MGAPAPWGPKYINHIPTRTLWEGLRFEAWLRHQFVQSPNANNVSGVPKLRGPFGGSSCKKNYLIVFWGC